MEEEVNNTPSRERRSRVRSMLSGAYSTVALTDTAVARAQEVKAMGFRTYDALHLDCAEGARTTSFSPQMIACSAWQRATQRS